MRRLRATATKIEPDQETVERALAVALASAAITRLLAEVDRLIALVPDTAAANASRRVAAQERRQLARRMRANGMTIPAIAKAIDRSPRQIWRYVEEA